MTKVQYGLEELEELLRDPLYLWSQVCETDEEMCRRVEFGARSFTAIDQTYQRYRATQLWGPYGLRWGLRKLKWSYVGPPDGNPAELCLEAEFFYPTPAGFASFELASDIAWKRGDDCRKKLWTDVIKKALATLGFSADVYQGRFDDEKYSEHPGSPQETKADTVVQAIEAVHDQAMLEKYMVKARSMPFNRYFISQIEKAYATRKAQLDQESFTNQAEQLFGDSDETAEDKSET